MAWLNQLLQAISTFRYWAQVQDAAYNLHLNCPLGAANS